MLFNELETINLRPKPFEFYTAVDLWTDEHTSRQMLSFHLNGSIDVSSRNAEFIRQSVDWIVSRFGLSADSSVADFGCGPGLYAAQLAGRQAKVTGIDFSRRSIEHAIAVAGKNGLPINYVHCNYLEFETEEKFDLILMIMCDFCALSPAQRETMLGKFSSMLKPEGRILLDVYSLTGFAQRQEAAGYELNQMNGFWSPGRYYGFFNTFKYEEEKVVLDQYTIVELDRTRTVYNWLQYFSPEALREEFSSSGMKVTEIYSDVAGKPFDSESAEFAVVAERL
ncbi:MAG: class I SAM-dependent methyltransferase [Deltaproteobacteria bacterium]|nr:class I SAM-dependent methyltransferase [Deltaproteobacteria bacterium]